MDWKFGLVELFDHTIPWVILGLLVAAWIDPLLADTTLRTLPNYVQVPLFALIGIPVYVCASGSTPVAAVLIFQGVSPGAAFVFHRRTGDERNDLGILTQLHGRSRPGFCCQWPWSDCSRFCSGCSRGANPLRYGLHHHEAGISWSVVTLVVLGVLFIASLMRQGLRGAMAQISEPIHNH